VASLVEGKVELGHGGGWRPLAEGAAVLEGDQVRTDAGARAELLLPDGSKVRLGPRSQASLDALRVKGAERERVSVGLALGRLWARVAKSAGGERNFEVATHNGVAGVRGTAFAVVAAADASALVKVYSGTVGVKKTAAQSGARKQVAGPTEIDRRQWEEVVASAMKQVKISSIGELSPAEDFEDAGDDKAWAQWNQARDKGG
jgi:hypothetical protein